MKKKLCSVLVVVSIAGCVETAPPVVSDFNGDSVKIVQNNYFGEGVRNDQTDAEAARICGKRGLKPEFASVRQLPNYQLEYLYLCL